MVRKTVQVRAASFPADAVSRALRVFPLFEKWPDSQRRELIPAARLVCVNPGETLIRQGEVLEGLYGIVSGAVEVASTQQDGRWYTRRLALPGMISGFLSSIDKQGSPYYYIALEPTTALFVKWPDFVDILERHPQLWMGVVTELLKVQRLTLAVIEEHIFESARVRMVRLLMHLASMHGKRERGTMVRIPLTQDKLASLLGISRQSTSKELKLLERAGVVGRGYGSLLVDLEKIGRKLKTRSEA